MKKLATLLIVLLAAACADEPQTDLEGLKAMQGEWQAAFDSRDGAAIAAVYAANGAVHPPNGKTVKGRSDVAAFWDEFLASGIGGQIDDAEVYANGDVGYKVGTYMVTDPAGAPIDVGKYVEIWRYANGKWQMRHDIFNSDMPLPAAPTPAPEMDDEAEVIDEAG
jgi:ketosteroid isomerase-like protein